MKFLSHSYIQQSLGHACDRSDSSDTSDSSESNDSSESSDSSDSIDSSYTTSHKCKKTNGDLWKLMWGSHIYKP